MRREPYNGTRSKTVLNEIAPDADRGTPRMGRVVDPQDYAQAFGNAWHAALQISRRTTLKIKLVRG